MKTINQILVLLLVVMAFSSCHKREGYVYATSCTYFIDISFRDSLGNDLVAIMKKIQGDNNNSDLCKLEIKLQTGEIIDHDRHSGLTNKPSFTLVKYYNYMQVDPEDMGCYYLSQQLILPAEAYVLQQKLTYKIVCPIIFGDDLSHEVITYWDFSQGDINPPLRKEKFPECYGVTYEDQILIPVRIATEAKATHYSHFVDIVLGQ